MLKCKPRVLAYGCMYVTCKCKCMAVQICWQWCQFAVNKKNQPNKLQEYNKVYDCFITQGCKKVTIVRKSVTAGQYLSNAVTVNQFGTYV